MNMLTVELNDLIALAAALHLIVVVEQNVQWMHTVVLRNFARRTKLVGRRDT